MPGRVAYVSAMPRPLVGIALMVAVSAWLPVMDGLGKLLSERLPPHQIAWGRYLFHALVLLPLLVVRYGPRAVVPTRWGTQGVRALLMVGTALCFFSALARMPLADATAIFFVSPFIATALAPLVLGERVGRWRWGAVAAGLAGTLIVVRPGFTEIGSGVPFALGAGVGYALFSLATRKLAGTDPPLTTGFATGLVAALALSVLAPFGWIAPEPHEWALLALMGVLGAIGSVLIVIAYENAGAAQLAPFAYVEIPAATLVGYLLFGDFPDAVTWSGIAVIIAAGFAIAIREHRTGGT